MMHLNCYFGATFSLLVLVPRGFCWAKTKNRVLTGIKSPKKLGGIRNDDQFDTEQLHGRHMNIIWWGYHNPEAPRIFSVSQHWADTCMLTERCIIFLTKTWMNVSTLGRIPKSGTFCLACFNLSKFRKSAPTFRNRADIRKLANQNKPNKWFRILVSRPVSMTLPLHSIVTKSVCV